MCTSSHPAISRSTVCSVSATGFALTPDDRRLYETTKRTLAARQWVFVQDYADAKTTVVEDIQRRAGLPASLEP